jgi:hypothetical protein
LKIEPGRSLGRLQSGLDLRVKVPFDRSLLRKHTIKAEAGKDNGERYAKSSYA